MGGKKSSPPPPKPAPMAQVQTADIDTAQVAAEKALAAQGNLQAANDATSAIEEEEKRGQRPGQLGRARPRRERDPAAVANTAATGGMATSAILTG